MTTMTYILFCDADYGNREAWNTFHTSGIAFGSRREAEDYRDKLMGLLQKIEPSIVEERHGRLTFVDRDVAFHIAEYPVADPDDLSEDSLPFWTVESLIEDARHS